MEVLKEKIKRGRGGRGRDEERNQALLCVVKTTAANKMHHSVLIIQLCGHFYTFVAGTFLLPFSSCTSCTLRTVCSPSLISELVK